MAAPDIQRDPNEEWREAVPQRFADSALLNAVSRVLQVACLVYAGILAYWVWLAKDVAASRLFADPVFYGYSIMISVYIASRFVLAPFYRPTPDGGYRPTISIVVPAFNEEDCIGRTIDACYASDYPPEKLSVVVVDDGSSDGTWQQILAARERHPSLVAVQFTKNRGKRDAMAEGIRRSAGQVCVFIDSDSVIDADGLALIVQDFRDPRIGAVVGSAEVLNKGQNLLTKMQQVRYFVAFRVIKGSESLFGAVTCASGCFSAYRRTALLEVLDQWESQTFLGRKATFGDDRALTNYVLRKWRIAYQSEARAHTIVPDRMRQFLRQQLRWKKSWMRESIHVCKFIWRKHPVAALLTLLSVLFPWVAPLVLVRSFLVPALGPGDPLFYVMGAYVVAVIYALYYAITRRSPMWFHGISFVFLYMATLVWQTYYALFTLRDTSWGTRPSTYEEDEGQTVALDPVRGAVEPTV